MLVDTLYKIWSGIIEFWVCQSRNGMNAPQRYIVSGWIAEWSLHGSSSFSQIRWLEVLQRRSYSLFGRWRYRWYYNEHFQVFALNRRDISHNEIKLRLEARVDHQPLCMIADVAVAQRPWLICDWFLNSQFAWVFNIKTVPMHSFLYLFFWITYASVARTNSYMPIKIPSKTVRIS